MVFRDLNSGHRRGRESRQPAAWLFTGPFPGFPVNGSRHFPSLFHVKQLASPPLRAPDAAHSPLCAGRHPRGTNRPGRCGLPGNCPNPGHPGTGLRRGQRNIARMTRVPGNPAIFPASGAGKVAKGEVPVCWHPGKYRSWVRKIVSRETILLWAAPG